MAYGLGKGAPRKLLESGQRRGRAKCRPIYLPLMNYAPEEETARGTVRGMSVEPKFTDGLGFRVWVGVRRTRSFHEGCTKVLKHQAEPLNPTALKLYSPTGFKELQGLSFKH